MDKVCTKCGTSESSKWFSGPICRKCYRQQPHVKKREKACRDNNLDYYREYWRKRNSTPEQQIYNKERNALFYAQNKESISERKQAYRQRRKHSINRRTGSYQIERRQVDCVFRLRCILRSRLSHAVRGNYKAGSAIKDLGCSISDLKLHLESKFQPGMSWDNYGHKGWHIDHIIPLSSFDLSDPEQLKKACHYSNLQPLWAKDNLKKGDRI